MGGCFGPKQRRQQVYMQVIQTIHQQVTHMTFAQTQNLDMYEAIRQKLSKKGLLRKLIDNLISHRNKIYDSLNHNYQIVLQNTKIQNKYAGLLIIDQIIGGIYKKLKQKKQQGNETQDYTNGSAIKSQINTTLPQIFKDTSVVPYNSMQANYMIRDIDSRFDTIYFNLIKYLLQNVSKMYLRILKSINSLCLIKQRKFTCTESVWQVLNFIMSKIVKNTYLKQGTYTYNLLLHNTKQNFKDHQKSSDVRTFIKIWISQKQKFKSSLDLSPQQQLSVDSAQEQVLRINAVRIISCYFNTNISTWNSQFLYDIVLNVYDQRQFDLNRVNQFENLIHGIVIKNDLHVHFFRGIFLELLQYICLKHHPRLSNQSGTYVNFEQTNKYNIIGKKSVKFNAIKTIRRWIGKRYADLNQTVSYNCSLLVAAYVDNLQLFDNSYNSQILKQFLKLIRQNLTAKSKQILVAALIQKVKETQTIPKIRSLILSLIRQFLQDQEIFVHFGQDFDYILPVEEYYPRENQLELVQLMGFIVKSLPDSFFSQTSDPNSSEIINFKHNIAEFITSCYSIVKFAQQNILFRYRFCCALLSFLKAIQLKNNHSFLYAFFLQLIKELTIPTAKESVPQHLYFTIYLAYEISHILVPQIQIPANFKIINQKISNSNPKYDPSIDPMIKNLVTQQIYTSKEQIKKTFQIKMLQNVLEPNFPQKSLQSTKKIFQDYFSTLSISQRQQRPNIVRQNQVKENPLFQTHYSSTCFSGVLKNAFVRKTSIYHNSEDMECQEEDKNLNDVLNILHQ